MKKSIESNASHDFLCLKGIRQLSNTKNCWLLHWMARIRVYHSCSSRIATDRNHKWLAFPPYFHFLLANEGESAKKQDFYDIPIKIPTHDCNHALFSLPLAKYTARFIWPTMFSLLTNHKNAFRPFKIMHSAFFFNPRCSLRPRKTLFSLEIH